MLRSLLIKNYALIEEIQAEFSAGLTVITGETGAGKSILVDALGLLLGERASTEMIRSGEEKAVVEGVFTMDRNERITALLRENETESEGELILRREITARGQSRCFINDSPVNVSVLKEVGDVLVDLHGQHEHQSLLRPETHIDFLDDFGDCRGATEEFLEPYRRLVEEVRKKRELQKQEEQLKAKTDLYAFQMKEIDTVDPRRGEEGELESELTILENAERLSELTDGLYRSLYEAEESVRDRLAAARKTLEQLHAIDASFEASVGEARSAEVIVEELSKFIGQYRSKIEFNPERLEEIRERLGTLAMLKKKYGGTIETVIAHRTRIGEEFAVAQNFEAEIAKRDEEIARLRREAGSKAESLSQRRTSSARKLEKAILAALADLGIAKAVFTTVIDRRTADDPDATAAVLIGGRLTEATNRGVDRVEFFLSTNVGESVRPLAKVASGGEVSRIMLALKGALAASDKTPLLIFDEIDTGVSGKVGQAVGASLKRLAAHHQVIAITHLPQIAGMGDHHFAVEKATEGKRTRTILRPLQGEERVLEVAKLLSGSTVTEAGLKSARELMGKK